MRSVCSLIAIGEIVKNLDKISANSLLPVYPEVEWKKIMECAM